MIEEAMREVLQNRFAVRNQSTVGNELHFDIENEQNIVSLRLDLMSINIYVWVTDKERNKDRMFTIDTPSRHFSEIEQSRAQRASENLEERMLLFMQNAMTNDEIMNAEPAFEYYFNGGREENILLIREYLKAISLLVQQKRNLI